MSANAGIIGSSTNTRSYVGRTIEDASRHVNIKNNVYSRYNFFVEQYNEDCNRIGEIYMKKVPYVCFMDFQSKFTMGLAFIAAFIPFICFLMVIIGISRLILYFIVIYKVIENRARVKSPYKKMIYFSGDFDSCNAYFDINDIDAITNVNMVAAYTQDFLAFIGDIRSNLETTNAARIMIYTTDFIIYETDVFHRIIPRILFSIVLLTGGLILTYTTINNILL